VVALATLRSPHSPRTFTLVAVGAENRNVTV